MRDDTNLVPAITASADAQVRTENVAASRAGMSDPDVAAAMAEFAGEQIRRRARRGEPDQFTAAPPAILRLVE